MKHDFDKVETLISLRTKLVDGLPILLFFILLSVLYVKLKISKMWAFGDLAAFPTDVGISHSWSFYLWRAEGLGSRSFPPFSYYLIMVLSSIIFGSFTAQKIIFLSLPALSFFTFYIFLRKIDTNPIASALGSLSYSINPITVSELIGGSITLVVYSIFPLMFYYIIRIIKYDKLGLKDAVTLGFLGILIFNPHAAFWYVLVLIPLILFTIFCEKNIRKILRLAISFIVIILIFLPAIIGYATFFQETTSKATSFTPTVEYCYKDSTFYNIARLAGNTGSAQAKEFLNYNTLNSYTILGYALPIIAFLPFFTKNQCNNKKFLVISAAFAFILSFGLILIVKALPFIVNINPILASLRNPAKLMYPLSFSICFLFAIGTEQILQSRKKHKLNWNILTCITLITIILLYNYPALDGTLGLTKTRDENYYIEDKYYALPQILMEIDQNYKNYRFLILPWEYSMLLKISSEIPNYFGLPAGVGMAQDIEWLKNIFEATATKNSRDRSYILGLFGVKYVIIDKNFRSHYKGQEWYERLRDASYAIFKSDDMYWITGKIEYFLQIFRSDPNFDLVYENSDFIIFRNNNLITKIYVRLNNPTLTLSYTPISENLIKNPSFENNTEGWGLWPSSLVNITYNYQKNKTIILYGQKNWFTVCYQEVLIKDNALYNLKFSVKGYNITDMHVKVLWYNITENLKEGNEFSANYIKLNQFGLNEGEWCDIEETLLAPAGAVKARIYFLANRLNDFASTEMHVDDVSFQEVGIILQNRDEIFSSIRKSEYVKFDPTKYTVKVNATKPFMLCFTEAYDSLWVAYVNGEKINSIPLYGVINGFRINHSGILEITIEYEPQRWFYYGSIISVTTLIACITYLTYSYTKPKRLLQKLKQKLKPKERREPTPNQQKTPIFP